MDYPTTKNFAWTCIGFSIVIGSQTIQKDALLQTFIALSGFMLIAIGAISELR